MKYKVTIEELELNLNADKYDRWQSRTIYEQIFDELKIQELVESLNKTK